MTRTSRAVLAVRLLHSFSPVIVVVLGVRGRLASDDGSGLILTEVVPQSEPGAVSRLKWDEMFTWLLFPHLLSIQPEESALLLGVFLKKNSFFLIRNPVY